MIANATPPSLAADIEANNLISFYELGRRLKRNPCTPFRWATKGFPDGRGGRIRLLAIRKGKQWLTSWNAYLQFMASLPTNGAADDGPAIRTPTQRDRAARDAADELKRKHRI